MSRHRNISARARRAWAIGLAVFFVVLCGMIAWSQWYAVHVNVPRYRHMHAAPSL